MTEHKRYHAPTMQGAAIYRITVQGHLDPDWSDRIEGMNITESKRPDGQVQSILVGRILDQSALSGILNTLYELHLPVVSVNCLESE